MFLYKPVSKLLKFDKRLYTHHFMFKNEWECYSRDNEIIAMLLEKCRTIQIGLENNFEMTPE